MRSLSCPAARWRPTVTGFIVQASGSFVPALLLGAAVAVAAAFAYLVVIPNRPIGAEELERGLSPSRA